MSYIPVAVVAYVLNGVSVLANKFLLVRTIRAPIVYVSYVSATSLIALAALPWTHVPSSYAFLLASISTLCWTAGAYSLYAALRIGLVSRVAPVIDTLMPVLLLAYYFLVQHSITHRQAAGAGICALGLVAITSSLVRRGVRDSDGTSPRGELGFEFLAAVCFGASYILLREVYAHVDFLTGLVWSRFVLIAVGLLAVAVAPIRRTILAPDPEQVSFTRSTAAIFAGGQVAGGASQLLLSFGISLATPALVSSLQGTEYVFLFLASLVLSLALPQVYRERFSRGALTANLAGIGIIGWGLYVLA